MEKIKRFLRAFGIGSIAGAGLGYLLYRQARNRLDGGAGVQETPRRSGRDEDESGSRDRVSERLHHELGESNRRLLEGLSDARRESGEIADAGELLEEQVGDIGDLARGLAERSGSLLESIRDRNRRLRGEGQGDRRVGESPDE